MRAVVQRVNSCSVISEGRPCGAIKGGLCVLLAVGEGDCETQVKWMADKLVNLRIFEDGEGKMNRSLLDVGGQMMVVSQFTLYGDCRKGRRPSFCGAARPEEATRLYRSFVEACRALGVEVKTGVFQTHMTVALENDGPVTLIVDAPGGGQ